MTDLLTQISAFVQNLAAGPLKQPKAVTIPPANCLPAGSSGTDIRKEKCYLTLTVNQLFLSEARKWWSDYQPMVVVATSFIQGNTTVTVPAVVGPSLLQHDDNRKVPQGLLLNNIEVAGPIPYRGGNVTLSILLYRVEHTNHATALLKVVEGVSKAIGPAADLGMVTRVGGALMDGVGSLLSLEATVPIMGQRFTMSPVGPGGMTTFYAALIGPGSQASPGSLSVDHGKLRSGFGSSAQEFTSDDYVLYSLSAATRRTDETTLPFYPMFQRALKDASRAGDDNWKSAKATFSEVWQQMVVSPDLIPEQAEELFEDWRKRLLAEKERGEKMQKMKVGEEPTPEPDTRTRTRNAASVLDL
jgi:hypothetical protein